MSSSEEFIVEHEEEDRFGGKDVGTSTPAASRARAAWISMSLARKVARTTAETVRRQDPNSNEECSSWKE